MCERKPLGPAIFWPALFFATAVSVARACLRERNDVAVSPFRHGAVSSAAVFSLRDLVGWILEDDHRADMVLGAFIGFMTIALSVAAFLLAQRLL